MIAGVHIKPNRKGLCPHRVSRSTFIQLLTSRERLTRLDDAHNQLRGVVDADGNWYVIDARTLTAHGLRQA